MKLVSHFFKLSFLTLALVFVGCSDDDDSNPNPPMNESTIVETAIATADLSSLVAALQKADESADNDLVNALSGEGPFTVFAPTDDAFADLLGQLDGFSSLDDFSTTELQNLLATILEYHVVSDAAFSTDLSDGQSLTTLQGESLTVTLDGNNVFIGDATTTDAQVTSANIETSNGVVHIINKVLLPQAIIDGLGDTLLKPITDLAIGNENLQNLVAALTAANGDLPGVLRGDGPFTVLAPTDAAFEAFLDGQELGDIPVDVLTNVLLNHVIDGALFAADLTTAGAGYDNTKATNADGDNLSIYFDTSDGVVFNGGSSVVDGLADIKASNGVVHVVDQVIGLPTIVTFATSNVNFSTLVNALTELTPGTPFADILARTEGGNMDEINPDFTVFAPTNTAFSELEAIPEEDVLTQVLLHHVIGGSNVRSGDLTNPGDTTAPTLEGDDITITLPGTGENIANVTDGSGNTDAGIIAVDVQAVNGVIHVLNKVLLPDTTN
ncbi:fasciclin domain-containing protein [uncultured Croceitalea sp.]|uniref:fasciclin domain-containing protein n=1 Tax=uncultured Croceitalea sp. TaxID=1798908 RepID=UPI0033067560